MDNEIPNANRNELLALVAHELRNPLSAIAMGVQVIKRAAAPNPAVLQALAGIERQIYQLRHLVDDLTDVSRLLTNKIHLQVQSINTEILVEQAVEYLQPQIDAKHHKLNVKVDKIEISGDPTRLQQVICNLLSNAAKFTPTGGIIDLSVVAEGEGIKITVEDNGCGCADVERCFDMFYQAIPHNGTGLGIGLSLSRKIVLLHGGTITLANKDENKGCVVTVILPPCPVQPTNRSVRCLIVDDNADHANSLCILLEMENYQVRVAYDGPTGLNEINTFKPDVIFLDIGMPIMDGYEVMSRIIKHKGKPYVVALTGFGQPGDRARTKKAGFDEHIIKPPKEREILDIMEAMARQKQ